jgi:hypothetical protein
VTVPAKKEAVAFALAGAIVLLSQLGYSFERGDQLQYLLLPYRAIYPGFLPGDWFTWQTTHYHQTFSWLVIALHAAAGAWLPHAMLVAHFGVLCVLSYAIWRLSRALGYDWIDAAFALLVLAIVRETALAGDTVNHGQLVPSDIALPPFLLACAAWLERRALSAGMWMGLSGLFHANFAVLGPLVLAPLQAWIAVRERSPRDLLRMLAPYVAIASPTLLLTARGFLAADSAPEALSIVHRVRSPHHYDLAAFPAQDAWWLGLCLLAGLPAWLTSSWCAARPRNRLLLLGICAVLALGLLGSLLDVRPLVRLFVWRLTIVLIIIALLVAAHGAQRMVAERNLAGLLWLAAAAAALAVFARDDAASVSPWGVRGAWFALPAALPLAIGAVALVRRTRLPVSVMALLAAPVLAWAASIAAQPLPADHDEDDARRVRGLRLSAIALLPKPRGIFTKAHAMTPPDATFLIPPSLIGFRLQARRAVYVDWKCIPMKGEEVLEWQRRMLAAMGVSEFPARGYDLREVSDELYFGRSLDDLAALARAEGLDYVVAGKQMRDTVTMGMQRVYSAGRFRVFRVLTAAERAARIRAHEAAVRRAPGER